MKKIQLLFLLILSLSLLQDGCIFSRGQHYEDFTIRTPVRMGDYLVLGFLGGREKWNSVREGVRKLALDIRSRRLPYIHIETVENKKRELALRLIVNAFDFNRNGTLEPQEKESVRLVLYGQSFGGAAVVKLAKQLQNLEIPVRLTIQIDSVGRHDHVIPANVRNAANLFQKDGWLIRGEPVIRAADAGQTMIIGNFQYHYKNNQISLSSVPWWKKIFREAHSKMNLDPEVWDQVENLIINEISRK